MGGKGERRFTRRQALGAAGTAIGAGLIGGYLYRDKIAAGTIEAAENTYRRVKRFKDSDLDGLTDKLEQSESFRTYLENTFETDVGPFDPEQKDLIVDARYVEGETFSAENKEYLEELFQERIGVNLHWLDYPETYSREEFLEEQGYDPSDILWGNDSFYEEEIEDELKNTAMQIVFAPGKPDGENEGGLYCEPGDTYASGFSALNRAVIASRPTQDEQLMTTLHEMLHLGNWEHNYEDQDDPGVMGQQEKADATPQQWERLKNRLHLVNLSAPSFVYDYALDITECVDMELPSE